MATLFEEMQELIKKQKLAGGTVPTATAAPTPVVTKDVKTTTEPVKPSPPQKIVTPTVVPTKTTETTTNTEMENSRKWGVLGDFTIELQTLTEDGDFQSIDKTGFPGGKVSLPLYKFPTGKPIPEVKHRGQVPAQLTLLPGDKQVKIEFDLSYLKPHLVPESFVSQPCIYNFKPHLWLPGTAFKKDLSSVECDTSFLAQSHSFAHIGSSKTEEENPMHYDHPLLSNLCSDRDVDKEVLESAILVDALTEEPLEHTSLKFDEKNNCFQYIEREGRIPDPSSSNNQAVFQFKIGEIRSEAEWSNCFSLTNETSVYFDQLILTLSADKFTDWIKYLRTLPKCFEAARYENIVKDLDIVPECIPVDPEDLDIDTSIPLDPNLVKEWAKDYFMGVYTAHHPTHATQKEEENKKQRADLYGGIKTAIVNNWKLFLQRQQERYADSNDLGSEDGDEGEDEEEEEEVVEDDKKAKAVATPTTPTKRPGGKGEKSGKGITMPLPVPPHVASRRELNSHTSASTKKDSSSGKKEAKSKK